MPYTSLIKTDDVKYHVAAYVQSEPVDTILLCEYIHMHADSKRSSCLLCQRNDLIPSLQDLLLISTGRRYHGPIL